MGDLIVMARSTSPARLIKPKLDDRPAEILFFTGVRYYRMPDAVPAPVATKSRRRRPAVAAAKAPRLDCQA